MINTFIVIISLVLGAILYMSMRQRIVNIEQQLIKQDQLNHINHELMVKLNDYINQLIEGHNQIANALNEASKQNADSFVDSYSPFKTPKGEA